jgi:hypothetical protein
MKAKSSKATVCCLKYHGRSILSTSPNESLLKRACENAAGEDIYLASYNIVVSMMLVMFDFT